MAFVAHLAVGGQRQAFPGYGRPCDIPAQPFQLVPFPAFGRHPGMQLESGGLAHRVRIVRITGRKGLEAKHLVTLMSKGETRHAVSYPNGVRKSRRTGND